MSGLRSDYDAIMRQDSAASEIARANVKPALVKSVQAKRRRVVSFLFVCGALLSCTSPRASDEVPGALNLIASPLSLLSEQSPNGQEVPDLGALTWLGTLELRSPDPRFGGLSALLVSPDGADLTAVSDKGYRVQFGLQHDAGGRLTGTTGGLIAPLRGRDGLPMESRLDLDAEALARLPGGAVAVGFEHNHRLWRYAGAEAPLAGVPTALAFPPKPNALGQNSGFEAISELAGGGLLAIAEGNNNAGESPAFLWRDGRWHGMTYRRDGGFRPTGAALLPDGDILVVERFFTILEGVKIRLVRLPAASLRPGADLSGTVLATLIPPVALDNVEGVDARRGENGETLIYLISDDNYNPLQRTLLLQFSMENEIRK